MAGPQPGSKLNDQASDNDSECNPASDSDSESDPEVDFALGPFFLNDEREEVADFTATFYYDSYYIVSQRPVASSDPAGIIKTFQPQVWLLVAVCMAVVGVVMMGMMWLTERLQGSGSPSRVSWAVMWSVKGLLQEPTSWLPGNASGRLMVAVWVLSALVIASVYQGNITAMLTLPKIKGLIDTVTDLINQNRLPWKLEHGGLKDILLNSKDKAMQKMATKFSGFIPSCWSARHEIQTGKFAAACDKTSIMSMMAWDFSTTGRCHFYMGKYGIITLGSFSLLFPTNSSLMGRANQLIFKLTEGGLWAEWLAWQLGNSKECLKPPTADRGEGVKPLGVQDILGLLILLAIGYLASLLLFAGETLFFHRTNHVPKITASLSPPTRAASP
ncbi:hypothetical protein O3P69_000282 [Scylla paramamosain]|uniref:Ionotropic glutamate receptor C-terminal domain-containing protein n=1 Tax=Scylla paramamosain TaxID=85552 RepID=A0AAW0UWP3_SCYPA